MSSQERDTSEEMASARHPKAYPKGPGIPLTTAWKRKVLDVLAANEATGRTPASIRELSRMIGADPAGIGRMLSGNQPSNKFTRKICALLGIDEPMIERPVARDELDEVIESLRRLSPERRKRALEMLRLLEPGLDE